MNLIARLVSAAAATVAVTAGVALGSAALEGVPTRVEGVSVERAEPVAVLAAPVAPAVPVARTVTKPAVTKPAAKPVVRKAVPVAKPTPARVTKPKAVTTTRLTAAATASSYTRGCDGTTGWQARRGAYAMKRITYNWRKTGYTIRFMAARRGITGMTYPANKRIEVYVRSCSKMTNAYLAETIYSRATIGASRDLEIPRLTARVSRLAQDALAHNRNHEQAFVCPPAEIDFIKAIMSEWMDIGRRDTMDGNACSKIL